MKSIIITAISMALFACVPTNKELAPKITSFKSPALESNTSDHKALRKAKALYNLGREDEMEAILIPLYNKGFIPAMKYYREIRNNNKACISGREGTSPHPVTKDLASYGDRQAVFDLYNCSIGINDHCDASDPYGAVQYIKLLADEQDLEAMLTMYKYHMGYAQAQRPYDMYQNPYRYSYLISRCNGKGGLKQVDTEQAGKAQAKYHSVFINTMKQNPEKLYKLTDTLGTAGLIEAVAENPYLIGRYFFARQDYVNAKIWLQKTMDSILEMHRINASSKKQLPWLNPITLEQSKLDDDTLAKVIIIDAERMAKGKDLEYVSYVSFILRYSYNILNNMKIADQPLN